MKNLILLSAELSTLSATENAERSLWLATQLHNSGLTYERCEGCYCGAMETSYALPWDKRHADAALCLGNLFEQESLLFVDEHGRATLGYLREPKIVPLGRLRKLERTTSVSNYTIYRGTFYTTESAGL